MADFERAARFADESDACMQRGHHAMQHGHLVEAYEFFFVADLFAAHERAALRGEA